MRNPHKLKVRRYSDCIIDTNEYFSAFPGAKALDRIGETEINEIILNIIPNGWSKQAYFLCFDCETITLEICQLL